MDNESLFPPKSKIAVLYNDGSVLLVSPAILKIPCVKLVDKTFDIRWYY